jgi:hypothetical protein
MAKPPSLLDSLWASFGLTPPPGRAGRVPPRARLEVESLEDRTVLSGGLSSSSLLPPPLGKVALRRAEAGQSASASLRRVARQLKSLLAAQPLQISQVIVNPSGQLQAIGSLLGQTVNLPVTISNFTRDASGTTTVLHLQLGPVNLNLLGLVVRTTPICLDITAHKGQGLLGDLLTSADPSTLSQAQRADLLTQAFTLPGGLDAALSQLFNQAVQVKAKGAVAGLPPLPPGHPCPILRLQLGPVDLNLLGLNVHLDNCANGPIVVDVTAVRGAGLLGNLLCGLVGNGRGA